MERSSGLDVHAASATAAVIDARGKRIGAPHVLETNGEVLVEFVKLQPGTLHVCLEEGTHSTWLAEILRTGARTTTVYKGQGDVATSRHLVKVHDMVVRDTVRTQHRLEALFRARGIPSAGKEVYTAAERETWLATLPDSSRGAAG